MCLSWMTYKSSPYLDMKSISLCCLQGCTLMEFLGCRSRGSRLDTTTPPAILVLLQWKLVWLQAGMILIVHRLQPGIWTDFHSAHPSLLCTEIASGEPQHTITIWSLFGTYRRTTGVTMPRLGERLRGRCEVSKRGRQRGRRSTQLAPCKRNQEADRGMQTIRLKRRANRCWYRFSQNESRDCLVSSALLRNGTSL